MTSWPGGARGAVAFTFDFDAEEVWIGDDPENANRPGVLSQGTYGAKVAVPLLLELLEHHGLKQTFFVPGRVAERHPGRVEEILAAGHEVGHHGYLHLRSDGATDAQQREEIERGLEALATLGVTPRGYRSPSWELTPETFALLKHYGFAYDSSLMGDDRPYVVDGLLELPVHWSLDDWPHLHWKPGRGDAFTSPEAFLDTWLREFDSARRDRRHLTYTMHPEVIGRGYRAQLLDDLIMNMTARANVWFPAHEDVAAFGVG